MHALSKPRLSWVQLTRSGLPEFQVIRLSFETTDSDGNSVVYKVGDRLPHSAVVSRDRLRQLYDTRMIGPVETKTVEPKPVSESSRPRSRRYVSTGVSRVSSNAAITAAREV